MHAILMKLGPFRLPGASMFASARATRVITKLSGRSMMSAYTAVNFALFCMILSPFDFQCCFTYKKTNRLVV